MAVAVVSELCLPGGAVERQYHYRAYDRNAREQRLERFHKLCFMPEKLVEIGGVTGLFGVDLVAEHARNQRIVDKSDVEHR